VDAERYVRPKPRVLSERSLVPQANQIRPAPNHFTHQLIITEPFYFGSEADSDAPDGQLDAGTKVVLLRYDGGARCRVADGRGLYVEISYANLAKLEGS
jgi:hypothetical protein